jgi:hypothetical protein
MSNHQKPRRAINEGPKSSVGQARYHLYGKTLNRIKDAMEVGYYLEAVTLVESLIADRLEARLALCHDQDESKRKFSTLGKLAEELSGKRLAEPASIKPYYEDVIEWADRRNKALHELAKLPENSEKDWDEEYKGVKDTAEEGLKIFRNIDQEIRNLNRY